MKLELKHIAPYLPYKLRVALETEIFNYDGLRTVLNPHFLRDWHNKHTNIKPILRPLSDLTKEIEHNGEKFVPMDMVGEKVNDLCKCNFIDDWSIKGDCFETYVGEFIDRVWNNHHLDYLPFGFIQKLLEWHFDIYGLIDQNLAVDINTLKE